MRKVQITSGAYGYRPEGSLRVRPTTSRDGPIELADEEAERLVKLGVARYTADSSLEAPTTPVATPEGGGSGGRTTENPPDGEGGSQGPETPKNHLDPEGLMKMTRPEMEKLAVDMGVDVSGAKNKTEIAQLLAAVPVSVDEDADGDDAGAGDGEDPPDLSPEVPET